MFQAVYYLQPFVDIELIQLYKAKKKKKALTTPAP